jgi:hypothetical protein
MPGSRIPNGPANKGRKDITMDTQARLKRTQREELKLLKQEKESLVLNILEWIQPYYCATAYDMDNGDPKIYAQLQQLDLRTLRALWAAFPEEGRSDNG